VTRPRLFIASAGDNLDVAYAIQSNLERDADCTVWTQGVMRLSRSATENVLEQLGQTDFGVFAFNQEDVVPSHGAPHSVDRDSIVLQMGMFAGRLGIESTFIVVPRGVDIKLPSDLLGLSVADYATDRRDGDLQPALATACTAIRRELRNYKPPEEKLPKAARVEARVGINAALDPIVQALADAADALARPGTKGKTRIRQRLWRKVLDLAVKVASQVVGTVGSTRSCYLELEAGPPMRLVPTTYVQGRRVTKRPEPFVKGTAHGDYVLKKALANEADFFPNLDEEAPPGFDIHSVEYRTFISVPVIAGTTAYGVLTADARKAGDLSDLDVDFMSVLAGLVAAAMAMSWDA
jgi:hypothetical protein